MGKQPQAQMQLHWVRRQSGHHTAIADGIHYHARRLGRLSWELMALTHSGPTALPIVVFSTWGHTLRELQITVRRNHLRTAERGRELAANGSPSGYGVLIPEHTLAALRIPTAALQLVHERGGWFACYTASIGTDFLKLPVFKPTATEALRTLDDRLAARFRDGSALGEELAVLTGR